MRFERIRFGPDVLLRLIAYGPPPHKEMALIRVLTNRLILVGLLFSTGACKSLHLDRGSPDDLELSETARPVATAPEKLGRIDRLLERERVERGSLKFTAFRDGFHAGILSPSGTTPRYPASADFDDGVHASRALLPLSRGEYAAYLRSQGYSFVTVTGVKPPP